jgi:hypothetical protein
VRLIPFCTLLLALAPIVANAAPDDRMVIRYGLSEGEFRKANDELMAKGERLADLTIAEVNGERVIGAIWTKTGSEPAFSLERGQLLQSRVFLKLGRRELEAKIEEFAARNSHLDAIDAYDIDGKAWFAAVFCPEGESPLHTVVAFLSKEDADGFHQEAVANGFELYRMEVAPDGKDRLYFPVFIQRPPTESGGLMASDPKQFEARRATLPEGLSPLSIAVYRGADGDEFYSLFDKSGSTRRIFLDQPTADFHAKVEPLVSDGDLPMDIDSFVVDGVVRYSAVLLEGPVPLVQ